MNCESASIAQCNRDSSEGELRNCDHIEMFGCENVAARPMDGGSDDCDQNIEGELRERNSEGTQ